MNKDRLTDIFFDLDHTLWDFEKNSALTFSKIFRKHNLDINLDDFLQVYIPTNLNYWKLYREEKIKKSELRYQRLKTTFDAIGVPIQDSTIDKLAVSYIEYLSSFNHLVPHTTSILEYLESKYRLHIITNGFQEIQEKKLRNSNIYHFFDQIIDSEMAGVKKPNPLIFNLALERAGVMAKNAVMIGDSLEADVLGARAVGLQTIHFNVHNEPDHEHGEMIQDLREIKSYL